MGVKIEDLIHGRILELRSIERAMKINRNYGIILDEKDEKELLSLIDKFNNNGVREFWKRMHIKYLPVVELTVRELRHKAYNLGIVGYYKKDKPQLIHIINEHIRKTARRRSSEEASKQRPPLPRHR